MFSRELNIWSWFHIVVVHRRWRNWQKAQCACKTVALLRKLGAIWPSRCGNLQLFRSLIKHVYREIRGRASSQAACTFLIFHINWIRIKINEWCPCSCIGSPSHYSGSVYGSYVPMPVPILDFVVSFFSGPPPLLAKFLFWVFKILCSQLVDRKLESKSLHECKAPPHARRLWLWHIFLVFTSQE